MGLLASGAFIVNTDDSGEFDDKLRKMLHDIQVDPLARDGLRLVVAFRKIKNQADRRMIIELAERLEK
jgi:urease gamma subunit